MSENNKPLIFLEPLSQTLKKLKEVLEENAEGEGIEIFDVETVEEAAQLIPTIGQAVILTASPKVCAMTLQTNRKFIKKLQTKTLLLTPKAIPRKTLDKFMKVGLTECIVEPVNPKTLLYKVRLQLRSISTEKPEDDGEMAKKFGDDAANQQVDTQKKLRTEKGVILNEEEEDATPRERKQYAEETLEDYSRPQKKNSEENVIDGFLRGTNKKNDESLEDEEDAPKKQGYKEEAIAGHYKGSIKKEDLEIEDDEEERAKLELPIMDEDLEAIKRQVNLEVEEDLGKEQRSQLDQIPDDKSDKKKSPQLNIEDNEEKKKSKSTGASEDLGGHYKGDVKKSLDVEDDEDEIRQEREAEVHENLKGKNSPQLKIEDDQDKDYLDESEREEEAPEKKRKLNLEIEDIDEKDYIEKPQLKVVDDGNDKDLLVEEEDYEDIKRKDSPSLNIMDDEDQDEIDPRKVDEIDGYLRGGKAKKDLNVEDDGEDLYKDEKLDQDKERKRQEMASLDLYDDNDKDELLPEKEYPEDDFSKDKKVQLNILEDGEFSKKDALSKNQEEGLGRKKSNFEEEDSGGFGKGHSAHTEKKTDRHNKSNARADQIKTHYSSRESIKHNEGNWDSNWEKAGRDEMDFAAKKKENEIQYANEDLGEQTIDYAQLKKEFEGMDYENAIKKKKDYGEFDQVAEIKTYTKTILSPTGSMEAMEFEEVKAQELEEEESHQVFLPDSKGIENVIEVLNFYYQEDLALNSIYNFVSLKINDLFKGDIALYFVDRQKKAELCHIGAIMRQVGAMPIAPKEEDALDKREFKLLKSEYDEEYNEYRKNALAIQMDWKDKWETRLNDWLAYQTPTWRDQTFQEVDNEFVFPFYEGVTLLGIAVFTPYEKFIESRAGALEVTLESMRSVMLTEFHTTKGATEQRAKTLPEEPKKSGGFFKKWFGKLAG